MLTYALMPASERANWRQKRFIVREEGESRRRREPGWRVAQEGPLGAAPEAPGTAAARSAVALSIARWERVTGAPSGTVLGLEATGPRTHPAPAAPGAAALLARLLACAPGGRAAAGSGSGAGLRSGEALGAPAEGQLAAAAAGEAAQTLLYALLRQGFRRRGAPAAKPSANPNPAPGLPAGAAAPGAGQGLEQSGPPAGADGREPGNPGPEQGSGKPLGQSRAGAGRHAGVPVAERLAEARRALAAAAAMLPGAAAAREATRSPGSDPKQDRGLIRVHPAAVGALAARAYVLCQGRPAAALALLAASVLSPPLPPPPPPPLPSPPSNPAKTPSTLPAGRGATGSGSRRTAQRSPLPRRPRSSNPDPSRGPRRDRRARRSASASPRRSRRRSPSPSPSSSPTRSPRAGAGGSSGSGRMRRRSGSDTGEARPKRARSQSPKAPGPAPSPADARASSRTGSRAAVVPERASTGMEPGLGSGGTTTGPMRAAEADWAALAAGEQPLAGAAAVRGAFAALLAPPGEPAR